jgi:hypothetical protein
MLFPAPSLEVRSDYLARLTGWAVNDPAVTGAATEADRLSFTQVRKAYILAGQIFFRRHGALLADELLTAIRASRREAHSVSLCAEGRSVGFGTARLPATPQKPMEASAQRRAGSLRSSTAWTIRPS